uniref:Auxin-responsive protein n=1 Tax=Kalanchoe fedtschenkoi TaxID=63787 RepID=A0A7N0T5N2_KALFE
MGDSSKVLKLPAEGKDWCQKDEHKLELRLGPPGEESNCFTPKPVTPSVCHKRVAPAPVVGWPPIRSFRKNISHGISAKTNSETLTDLPKQELAASKIPKNGLFVKINMDGVPIGRKIDLAAYESYEKLSNAIDDLFKDLLAAQRYGAGEKAKMAENPAVTLLSNKREEYTLVYEDNEGDRMLVGDVPWHMFVSAATRLRVMRASELPTLSLGSMKQEGKDGTS